MEYIHPKDSFIETGTINFLRLARECFFHSSIQQQCFSEDINFILVTKHSLWVLVIETLDALLRQDLEDQGVLEDLVDHLHHLCLVDLVDPRVKKRIIQRKLEVAEEISDVVTSLTTRHPQHTPQQCYICRVKHFNKCWENKHSLILCYLPTPCIRYVLELRIWEDLWGQYWIHATKALSPNWGASS